MIYEFHCNTCDHDYEFWFKSYKDLEAPFCQACGATMVRKYTAPALRCNGMHKTPKGMVEMGNDYPTMPQVDRYAGVEQAMSEYVSNNSDMEMSRL